MERIRPEALKRLVKCKVPKTAKACFALLESFYGLKITHIESISGSYNDDGSYYVNGIILVFKERKGWLLVLIKPIGYAPLDRKSPLQICACRWEPEEGNPLVHVTGLENDGVQIEEKVKIDLAAENWWLAYGVNKKDAWMIDKD